MGSKKLYILFFMVIGLMGFISSVTTCTLNGEVIPCDQF